MVEQKTLLDRGSAATDPIVDRNIVTYRRAEEQLIGSARYATHGRPLISGGSIKGSIGRIWEHDRSNASARLNDHWIFFADDLTSTTIAADIYGQRFGALTSWADSATSTDAENIPLPVPLSPFIQIGQKVDQARSRLARHIYEKLKKFVQRLIENEDDFRDEGVIPDLSAFDGLIIFLAGHPGVRMPALTLTKERAFVAIWDDAQKARIRLDFVNSTKVRWVIVKTGHKVEAGSGEIDQDALDKIIEAYQASDWMAA